MGILAVDPGEPLGDVQWALAKTIRARLRRRVTVTGWDIRLQNGLLLVRECGGHNPNRVVMRFNPLLLNVVVDLHLLKRGNIGMAEFNYEYGHPGFPENVLDWIVPLLNAK